MTQLHFQAGSRSLHEMVLSHGAFGFNNYSCELVGEAVALSRTRQAARRPTPRARGPWRVGPRGADLRVAHSRPRQRLRS